jgi:hypothetical protein
MSGIQLLPNLANIHTKDQLKSWLKSQNSINMYKYKDHRVFTASAYIGYQLPQTNS